jgi:hypothetical protein
MAEAHMMRLGAWRSHCRLTGSRNAARSGSNPSMHYGHRAATLNPRWDGRKGGGVTGEAVMTVKDGGSTGKAFADESFSCTGSSWS